MDSQLPDTPYNELAFNNAHYDIISDIVKTEEVYLINFGVDQAAKESR